MVRDIVYQYKSENNYKKEELGEIQTDFNMSFVIDGTKDSWKVQVISYIDTKIKPMTILKHPKTNTWWVVKHDKIEKHYNETGFMYLHNIQIQGAFEWLNSIDMTDHGYSNSRYTLRSVLFRLFHMSTLPKEWSVKINNQLPINTDLTEIVDYIKTFENYTLMSAIREFLDGYNMVGKLTFVEVEENNETYIKGLNLNTILKTGSDLISESVFNEVKEITTMDDNSYGTSVVSNAENVVSTQAKTYPTVGTKRLSSNAYNINRDNAVLKLPSPAFKVNYIQFVHPVIIDISILGEYTFYAVDRQSFDLEYEKFAQAVLNASATILRDETYANIMAIKDKMWGVLSKATRTTLYNVNQYNPQSDVQPALSFITPKDNPDFYMVEVHCYNGDTTYRYHGNLWLTDSDTGNGVDDTKKVVMWKKGSDEITNFLFLANVTGAVNPEFTFIKSYASTDLRDSSYDHTTTFVSFDVVHNDYILEENIALRWSNDVMFDCPEINFSIDTPLVVNYIPMNDLKIKYDNTAKGNEILLYNQNGKLTDSVALSKLMDSYSKEVEHPNITRSGIYYDFNNVPKVGNTCVIGGVKYVINNVSMDFERNENDSYVIYADFTMSANVATKSLMTNADTNIRDYGIPQKDNVKRKQLYRDFYEINYEITDDSDYDYYLPITKCLNIGNFPVSQTEYTAVIKVEWDEQEENSTTHEITNVNKEWYYQLDTINYSMQKSVYKVVDFKDNNIIGYDAQNATSAFQIQRIFSGMTDKVNTPISYVKTTGSQDDGTIRDIHIAMCDKSQLSDIYSFYQQYVNGGIYANYLSRNLINWSVFIDSKIYEGGDLGNGHTLIGAKDNCDFMISEVGYDKDAIEVPVFEYSCQIDDSEDVEIGDNIFDNKSDDIVYMYCFSQVGGGSPLIKPDTAGIGISVKNNTDDNLVDSLNPYHNSYALGRNACKLEWSSEERPTTLKITGYGQLYGPVSTPAMYYSNNGEITYDTNNVVDFSDSGDFSGHLHILRVAIDKNTKIRIQGGNRYGSEGSATITNVRVDKIFTIKDITKCDFDSDGSILLHFNHYKLN